MNYSSKSRLLLVALCFVLISQLGCKKEILLQDQNLSSIKADGIQKLTGAAGKGPCN